MPHNRSMPPGTIIPELAYPDVRQAATWLCQAFGFTERLRIADHRVQLCFGDGSIVVVQGEPGLVPTGQGVMVRVDDVDAHCARAQQAGARVPGPPVTHPYGERQYGVVDTGGHRWTFSESVADVHPGDWGGTLLAEP